MANNLDKYKKDLETLMARGEALQISMVIEYTPNFLDDVEPKKRKLFEKFPKFRSSYQDWYSEALALIKALLPDRIDDFVKYYKQPKTRKIIDFDNYTIEDYLLGIGSGKVGLNTGGKVFGQQLNILKSCKKRFESSLFDIKQLLQADIFDSELEAAKELNKKGFTRGAGAMAGVVLEAHFAQVCEARNIKPTKKHPTINDYNELLKTNNVIAIDIFRHVQLLGDLRNKCDHKKDAEPTKSEIDDLISGVEKIIKTVF